MTALTTINLNYESLAKLCVSGYASPHTQRIYTHHIECFLGSGRPLSRDGILLYLSELRTHGARPPTLNQALSAIRKLATEALSRGLITQLDHFSIHTIKENTVHGTHTGMWLTKEQVKTLYASPSRTTLMGKRDAAVLALLVGCGLRRSEAVSITWGHYAEREGRMCLVDIPGKGNKIRTIPVPNACANDLDEWYAEMESYGLAGEDELILRRLYRRSHTLTTPLTVFGIWHIVRSYAKLLNLDFTPHDLRRSMARLMYKAHVDIKQISLILGHSRISTTEKYINASLELEPGEAGNDVLDLDPNSEDGA